MLLISLAAVLLPGCNTNSIDIEQFKSINVPGLIVKGRMVSAYDENTWQTGYNPSHNEFTVFDDNFSNFVIISCSALPVKGETIKADIRYTTVDNIKHMKNVHFQVTDMDENSSLIWLYSQKNDVCAIVKMVR